MTGIPAAFQDLLTNPKAFAHLATIMPDGSPRVTPVWFDHAHGRIRVNTAKGRVMDWRKNTSARMSAPGTTRKTRGSSMKSSPSPCRPWDKKAVG